MIDKDKGAYPVALLCRVLRVSESAYYAHASGKSYGLSAQKAEIAKQVKEVFDAHRRRYGSRRIQAELAAQNIKVGRFQIRSLMRSQELQAIAPRRFRPQTTDSRHSVQPSPNLLLDEQNAAQQPGEVIVGDITYLPLSSGKWSYLASWQDQFTKRIVGLGGRWFDDRRVGYQGIEQGGDIGQPHSQHDCSHGSREPVCLEELPASVSRAAMSAEHVAAS